MIDAVLFWILVVSFLGVVGAIYGIFAVISNRRHNAETIEEANKRLIEMQEEYNHLKKRARR